MSRKWNGKALVDELSTRLWDVSDANKERVITWINEIQDDIVSDMPIDAYKFKMKKLFPVSQEIIDISPPIPTAPTAALAAGGSLVEGSIYKVLISFVIWDADTLNYIESEGGVTSGELTATSGNKTINLTAIPLMGGTASIAPTKIWRRVYLQMKTTGDFSEPLFIADIEDNTTLTLSITAESSSTISPPSDTEVDQIASDNLYNLENGKYLDRQDMDDLRRFNPSGSQSGSPSFFDYVGPHRVKIYPSLSSGATDGERTMNYFVHRRPHEIFYSIDRKLDLPISFKKALIEGVLWKGYEFRDRDGHVSKLNNYMNFKKEALNKIRRLKNRPSVVRDVVGDTFGYEV